MPSEASASFRAEHPLRFLRRDFKANLKRSNPVTVSLKGFEPDLSKREPARGKNDLSALLGEPAPEIG